MIAISPERPEFLKQMIDKHRLTFDILSDAGNGVAEEFGLKFHVSESVKSIYRGFGLALEKFNGNSSWTLPMPARFIIDGAGIARYVRADPDYTTRPEPSDTLAALHALARGSS